MMNITSSSTFPLPQSWHHRGGGIHLHLSPSHVFITAQPQDDTLLVIHPTTTATTQSAPLAQEPNTLTLDEPIHSATASPDVPGLLCCSSDAQVLLVHWDALLGEWERLVVSQGEGRIGSIALVAEGNLLWVAAFKWDVIVVYLVTSVHHLNEPGPLVLESIEVVATLKKGMKEATLHPHAFLGPDKNSLLLLGVSAPLSIKMWEIPLHPSVPEKTGRLVKQSSGMSIKGVVASDLGQIGRDRFLLLVSGDGVAEVLHVGGSADFSLLTRFRVVEEDESVEGAGGLERAAEEQFEWRVLGAKFCCSSECDETFYDDSLNDCKDDPLVLTPQKRLTFPRLPLIVLTTRGFTVINGKSGHVLRHISYRDLLLDRVVLGDEGVVATEAQVAGGTGGDTRVTLGLRLLFSDNVHLIRMDLSKLLPASEDGDEDEGAACCSLITSDVINTKSVLRKRFKCPALPPLLSARRKSQPKRVLISRGGVKKPAWACTKGSRSRPSPHKRTGAVITQQLSSARSHSPVQSDDASALMPTRPVPLTRRGSYDSDKDDAVFGDRLRLSSGLMGGHSYLRLAMAPDGSVLAGGGSISPVGVMKTYPSWETVQTFKDVGRVTSLHFNFHSNLLLVGSNDGRTRVMSWRHGKELLSWEFSSKFNEHLHTQFYFMDKFVLQPQQSSLALYAIGEMDGEDSNPLATLKFQKRLAATFPLDAQSITAVAAPNRFLSSQILAGLSNKGFQVMDVNAERVSFSVRCAHSKPVTCIRLNEAPLGGVQTSHLSDIVLTSAPSYFDPVKLWDLRLGAPVLRLSDINAAIFVPPARPALSPCGRFIATGCEDNSLILYDTRRMQSRHSTFGQLKSTVLDCVFDPVTPSIWAACRDGCFWKFS